MACYAVLFLTLPMLFHGFLTLPSYSKPFHGIPWHPIPCFPLPFLGFHAFLVQNLKLKAAPAAYPRHTRGMPAAYPFRGWRAHGPDGGFWADLHGFLTIPSYSKLFHGIPWHAIPRFS